MIAAGVSQPSVLPTRVAGSIDDFEQFFFTPASAQLSGVGNAEMKDLVQFVRQLDTGVAPIVGLAFTVNANNHALWATLVQPVAAITRTQVERGHAGFVVIQRLASGTTRWYYDATQQAFVDAANSAATTTLAQLVPPFATQPLTGNESVVFQATPVGSARRIASATGQAPVESRPQPSITNVTMVVADPWRDIVALDQNLPAGPGQSTAPHAADLPGHFDFGASTSPKSLRASAAFFSALANSFGVPATPRHEAPRRFRVYGTDIYHGATLAVRLPLAWNGTTPTQWRAVTMTLHPVRDAQGALVWETSAVIAPALVQAMQCGWFAAPGVQATWDTGVVPSGSPLDPANYNLVRFTVTNEHPATPLYDTLQIPLVIE